MYKEFNPFKVTVGPWDKLHHHEDSVQITADYPATLNIPPPPQKELKILRGGGVRGPGISGEGGRGFALISFFPDRSQFLFSCT